MGDEYFPAALERMHIAYRLVRKNIHKQTKKNKSAKPQVSDNLTVGDAVYYRNHTRTNKLQKKWQPHYRVIAQRGPVSFTIKDQVSGKTCDAHAKDLRVARDDEMWATDNGSVPKRKATLAVPDSDSGESSKDSESSDRDTGSDSDDTVLYDYTGPRVESGPLPDALGDAGSEPTAPASAESDGESNPVDSTLSDQASGETEAEKPTPDQESDWSDDDLVPLAELRGENLNQRRQRAAKTKAHEKLKRIKNLLMLVTEFV